MVLSKSVSPLTMCFRSVLFVIFFDRFGTSPMANAESIAIPCSENTYGKYFLCWPLLLLFKVTIWHLKHLNCIKKYWVGTFAPTLLNTLFYAINSEWLGISSCNILYITLLVYLLYYNFIFIPKSNNKCKLLSSFTLSFDLIHIFLVIFYFKIISKKILFCEYFF